VLLGEVPVPETSELPLGLRSLADLQVVRIDHEHLESSIGALVTAVRHALDDRAASMPGAEEHLDSYLSVVKWVRDDQPERPGDQVQVETIAASPRVKLAVDAALLILGASGMTVGRWLSGRAA
jgi:hypothetical protein